MDMEQEEMQFLGIFGIYKEAYKVIFRWRKIFSQITLALILPLAFIILAHIEISDLLFFDIIHTENQLDNTQANTPRYKRLSKSFSSELTNYWLFQAAYFTVLLIFSLLSTAAVVYTIASIYTGREVTFKKIMSVVPKVWKRLMVTFLCIFVAMFAYNVVAFLVFLGLIVLFENSDSILAPLSFILVVFLYLVGFVYFSVVWHLASVVTVLEDSYGIKAMIKSRALIKGKLWVSIFIFLKLNSWLWIIQSLFNRLVVFKWSSSMVNRVSYSIICFLFLFMAILFGLIIQTVIYFVCKSYHHENIDKSTLSDRLEVYLGDYVPLKTKDVQLEQYEV